MRVQRRARCQLCERARVRCGVCVCDLFVVGVPSMQGGGRGSRRPLWLCERAWWVKDFETSSRICGASGIMAPKSAL